MENSETTNLLGDDKYLENRAFVSKTQHNNDVHTRREKALTCVERWLFVLSGVLLQIILCGIWYGFGVLLPDMVRVFNVGRTEAALVMTIYIALLHIGGIAWTSPARRFGDCQCALAGVVVGVLGLVVSALATGLITVIIMAGVISGLSLSCAFIMPYIVFVKVLSEGSSPSLICLTVGISMGQMLAPLLFQVILVEYGLAGSLLLAGGLVLQCVPCCTFMLAVVRITRASDSGSNNTRRSQLRSKMKELIKLYLDKEVIILSMIFFLSPISGNFEAVFTVDVLETRGYDSQQGSFIVSMFGLANFVSRMFSIVLVSKCRFPTAYHWIYTFITLAAGHIMFLYSMTYWLNAVSCMFVGLSYGVVISVGPVALLEAVGEERYKLLWPVFLVIFGVGDICHGEIAGFVKDLTGTYDVMLYVCASASGLGSLLVVFMALTRNKSRTYHVQD